MFFGISHFKTMYENNIIQENVPDCTVTVLILPNRQKAEILEISNLLTSAIMRGKEFFKEVKTSFRKYLNLNHHT